MPFDFTDDEAEYFVAADDGEEAAYVASLADEYLSRDVAVPVRFFLDADSGAVDEVQLYVPTSKALACTCVSGLDIDDEYVLAVEQEGCIHIASVLEEIDANHGMLPMPSAIENLMTHEGSSVDLSDEVILRQFREAVILHSRVVAVY